MRQHHARLLRASVITAVIIALSSIAHLAGGGSLPDPAVVVGLTALTMLAVTTAAKRTLSLPVLTLILSAAQGGLHHLFGTLSAAVHCEPGSHAHHAITTCTTAGAGLHHQPVDAGLGSAMFIAHALATVATAVVITRGEEAIHATAAWLRPLFSPPQLTQPQLPIRLLVPVATPKPVTSPYLVAPPSRGPPITSH
ncbi:hypothetical protein [Arthrobacter roseus]|uniref:hypothetical protein n=1 Tax=Arthrobacter roseus TaxID=136274 RepID=UPI0019651DC9|nr:hypothetical protein [Arthrobacter roseus]MBM7847582.1 hypothetical protein [Arthrobacter roseus]